MHLEIETTSVSRQSLLQRQAKNIAHMRFFVVEMNGVSLLWPPTWYVADNFVTGFSGSRAVKDQSSLARQGVLGPTTRNNKSTQTSVNYIFEGGTVIDIRHGDEDKPKATC